MRRFCTPLLLLPLFLPSASYAMMSSTNFEITSSVISAGSGSMSSANFSLTATLGQSSPLGETSSTSFNLDSGFWNTLLHTMVGDVNGDGDIDLEDVITALQVTTGQSPATIMQQADMDGDGKIGIVEALMLLKQLGGP